MVGAFDGVLHRWRASGIAAPTTISTLTSSTTTSAGVCPPMSMPSSRTSAIPATAQAPGDLGAVNSTRPDWLTTLLGIGIDAA